MSKIDIYTDGSHLDKQNNGRLGCGGVMIVDGKLVDKFSVELKPTWLVSNYGSSTVSNPTAEMLGLLTALTQFDIPSGEIVTIHADYLGVKSWMEGTWKIKEPYLKKIKFDIDKIIKKKGLLGKIEYKWVKGHQKASVLDPDAMWNNFVDKLAKGENVE